MDNRGVPAALITNDQNVRYLSGFTGDSSALLITAKRMFVRNLKGVIHEYAADNSEADDELRELLAAVAR